MHVIETVNGKILWANLILLFTLSLIPFTTGWMGENHFAPNTIALYGFNLLLCAVSYTLLAITAIKHDGKHSVIAKALSNKSKENISMILYILGTVGAFFVPMVSLGAYIIVAVMWLIPDRRIEREVE